MVTLLEPVTGEMSDLTRTGDRWEQVWRCNSDNRKPSLYTGRVRQGQVSDERVSLVLQMR